MEEAGGEAAEEEEEEVVAGDDAAGLVVAGDAAAGLVVAARSRLKDCPEERFWVRRREPLPARLPQAGHISPWPCP